jgi:hypothetical protein
MLELGERVCDEVVEFTSELIHAFINSLLSFEPVYLLVKLFELLAEPLYLFVTEISGLHPPDRFLFKSVVDNLNERDDEREQSFVDTVSLIV